MRDIPDRSKLAQLMITGTGKLQDVARERTSVGLMMDAETADIGCQWNAATECNDRKGDIGDPST